MLLTSSLMTGSAGAGGYHCCCLVVSAGYHHRQDAAGVRKKILAHHRCWGWGGRVSLLSSTPWVGVDIVNIDSTVCKGVSDAMRQGDAYLSWPLCDQ